MSSKEHLKKIRFLSIALFLSGAFNIILLALSFFWVFYEEPLPHLVNPSQIVKMPSQSNADVLKKYKEKPFEELVLALSKTNPVEDGLEERDLALGVLVTFHEFDLERALGIKNYQKKLVAFDEGRDKVAVFPNISTNQFETIRSFIGTEKWPFKPYGLFLRLKSSRGDESLKEAIYKTAQFRSLETLFQGKNIAKSDLLQMVEEGPWGILSAFHEKQLAVLNVNDESRQNLLNSYIKAGSKKAVQISQGGNTAKNKPFDNFVQFPKTKEPSKVSVRIDPPSKKSLLYIVQDGDSLWKISKRFKVPIEEIRALNALKADSLKPGTPLKITDNGL